MKNTVGALMRILEFVLGLLLILTITRNFVNVIGRYVVNQSILGVEDTKRPGGFEMFYEAPEAGQIVSKLRNRGFGKIRVLDKKGYEPLDLSRVKDVQ